jgi:hypothetical protein
MTWVVAASTVFGYGALFSDVQVTFRNGTTADLVQKAFPIADFIAAGFAGSVRIGYMLLQSLANYTSLSTSERGHVAWDPLYVFKNWPARARPIFDSAPPSEKKLGAQLLLVGVSPSDSRGPFPKVYFSRFVAPSFRPGIMHRAIKMCSIGSGAGVVEYKRALKPLFRLSSGILRAETGQPGGWAQTLAFSISRTLNNYPRQGISRHLHIVTVMRGNIYVSTNDEKIYARDGSPIEIKMPRVARGYEDFVRLANACGQDSAGATC